jgi:hypothetical protein
VSVIARDDQSESEPITSPRIEVMNAAPVITSQPDLGGSEGTFAYQMKAVDADGDDLRFGLGKGVPEGMTVSAESGEVSWAPRDDQAGAHPVEIWVEDPQGARATQRFELTIGASAGFPTTPGEPPPAASSEE